MSACLQHAARSSNAAAGRLFLLDPTWTFVNHGAFGASLKPALEVAHRWAVHLVTMRGSSVLTPLHSGAATVALSGSRSAAIAGVRHSRAGRLCWCAARLLAQLRFIVCTGADRRDLVLVPNATTALTAIFKSLRYTKDDHILRLNLGYGQLLCAAI